MSNSKLICYTKLSPNCNKPRNAAIDRITIHHMAGNLTIEQCGEMFARTSRQASSNYGIGSDGRIGLYVDEANRSWCSSSPANDHRAITIEVANAPGAGEPDWKVTDKALAAAVDLCTDICKRNGKSKLVWISSKDKALAYKPKSGEMVMTMHKWFAATGCPGPYLGGKFSYIAKEVNKRLGSKTSSTTSGTGSTGSVSNSSNNSSFKAYQVKITYKGGMNVRKGAGVDKERVKGVLAKYGYIYTIVSEKVVSGQTWGKLKSGAGWICLTGFTKKV